MGVTLLGKTKIHEIAKELSLTSKEIMKRAEELGIEVKNHMSSIEEELAQKIKESFKTKKKDDKKVDSQEKKEKKTKQDTPVIIRREVIVSEEELTRREEEEKKKKMEAKRKEVGFVERNTKQDYNIVYRNKPSKPMTVSELFGLKAPKQEEVKEEIPKEEKQPQKQESVIQGQKTEKPKEIKQEQTVRPKQETVVQPEGYNNQNRNNNHFNKENRPRKWLFPKQKWWIS